MLPRTVVLALLAAALTHVSLGMHISRGEEADPHVIVDSPQDHVSDDPEEVVSNHTYHDLDDHQHALLRREVQSEDSGIVSRRIGRTGITIVERLEERRQKRATFNGTYDTWPHDIPFVFDASYPKEDRIHVHHVTKYLASRLCVTFHDVTDTYDPSDPDWFTKNGFKFNSYIELAWKGDVCQAVLGRGTSPGPRRILPCRDFRVILHELMHALGVAHSQNGIHRDSFLSVNEADILSDLVFSYGKITTDDAVDAFFDPQSVMMYGDRTWNANGQETYTPIRDDLFDLVSVYPYENAIFYELSKVYRCNELFCNNDQTDCEPGYHTLVGGVCGCVCPDDRDPATNCKSQINKPTMTKWPATPTVLLGANGSCPTGFDSILGKIPMAGTWAPVMEAMPVPLPVTGDTVTLSLCTKTTPTNPADVDWSSWPIGSQYCMVKPVGVDCGGLFKESKFEIKTKVPSLPRGNIGDAQVIGYIVSIKFCCQKSEPLVDIIDLPNGEPFRLQSVDFQCPVVRGMRETKGVIDFWTKQSAASGEIQPYNNIYSSLFRFSQCYYQPPKYGCNQMVTLNKNTRSVTLTTPEFGAAREPNRRCFYGFNVPADAQIRVTFDHFDLHLDDNFLVKKYHKWQSPYRVHPDNWPYQFVSESNYLAIEYWASWQQAANKGVKFTVDLILPEDYCYDVETKGKDYHGDKSISETYEACLPWEKAVTCSDFPFNGLSAISLLTSDNKCRNPGGELDQPWCYVFVNSSVCHRRYCDVCNFKTVVDVIENCAALRASDPDFCNSAVERYGCFKTCQFPLQEYDPSLAIAPRSIEPREGECSDRVAECQDVLSKFPDFCQDERSKENAQQNCAKSCGLCGGDIQCSAPNSNTYTVVSSTSNVGPGGVMTFKCNPDLYHVGGNLRRACSLSGQLLGGEPKCQATPVPVDLKLDMLRRRRETLDKRTAVLLDHDGYRIPFNGKVTRWYYYCDNPGMLHFLIYRPSGSGYTYIGSNSVKCEADWTMAFNVPASNQISVQKNDVFGVYTPDTGVLSVSKCDSAPHKILKVPSTTAASFSELAGQTVNSFSGQKCVVPSLALRVEP